MSVIDPNPQGITRRAAVKAAAATAATLATGPAVAAFASEQAWDITSEVVICGYGPAGAYAAIKAHDAGAQVTVLERATDFDDLLAAGSDLAAFGIPLYSLAGEYATGDGIRMALACGAALQHVPSSLEWFELAFVRASEEVGAAVTVRQWATPKPDSSMDDLNNLDGLDGSARSIHESRIFVNMAGQRFMDESAQLVH